MRLRRRDFLGTAFSTAAAAMAAPAWLRAQDVPAAPPAGGRGAAAQGERRALPSAPGFILDFDCGGRS